MFNPNARWKYSRRSNRIINFCEYYLLEDNLEIESFNKKWSNPELRKYLRKKYRRTWKFLKAIIERIVDNSNLIIVIYGTPNSGKSEGGQTIAFFIRYVFWKYMGIKVKIYTVFSTSDFQEKLPEIKIGDVGIRDESPDEVGYGSKNVKKYLNNITRIIRQEQNSFIFIDPVLFKPKVVSFYLETAGKNKKTRKIRFILYDKDHNPLGNIYLPLHWCGLFRKKYNRDKTTNIKSGLALSGMETPEIPKKRIERDEKRLLKYCREQGVTKKGAIKGAIDRYNRQFDKKEDMIKGDINYMSVLISNVWTDLNKWKIERIEREIEKQKDVQRNIKYMKGDDFPTFVKNNIQDSKYAKVGQGIARGDSVDTIIGNNEDIKQSKLAYMIRILRYTGDINIRLGFLFEKWFALKIGVPKEKLGEVLTGTSDRPDLIWNGIIYSIKWRSDRKSKSLPFYQSKKGDGMRPEYLEALKQNTTYKLVFMNPAWDMRVRIFKINPKKNDKVAVPK